MSTPKGRLAALLLALILALSAFLQATVVSRTTVNAPLRVDALDYFSYAVNLREHGVYSLQRGWLEGAAQAPAPDALRVPGYPLLLAALDPKVSWQWLRRLGYLQSAFLLVSVAITYLLGRRFVPEGWALLGAFLVAICPSLVVMATYVLTEALFSMLLLSALLASASAVERRTRWQPALLAGLLWGASALVRPTTQLLPAIFLFLALLLPRLAPWRKAAAVGLFGFVLVLAPWVLRNQTLPPAPPGANHLVRVVAHGSYPNFMYEEQPQSFGYPYRSDPRAEERARDWRSLANVLAAEVRRHPGRMLRWYFVGKPVAFLSWADPQSWDIFIYGVSRSPYLESRPFNLSWKWMYLLHAPLVLLAMAAMALVFWRPDWLGLEGRARGAATLVAITLAYGIGMHMLVAPFARYNLPFRPLIYLLATLALHAALLGLRKRRTTVPVPAALA